MERDVYVVEAWKIQGNGYDYRLQLTGRRPLQHRLMVSAFHSSYPNSNFA